MYTLERFFKGNDRIFPTKKKFNKAKQRYKDEIEFQTRKKNRKK